MKKNDINKIKIENIEKKKYKASTTDKKNENRIIIKTFFSEMSPDARGLSKTYFDFLSISRS